MSTKKENTPEVTVLPTVDEQEYETVMEEAKNSAYEFTVEFATPFTFEGDTFEKLSFNFGGTRAKDSLAIESELNAIGKTPMVLAFSGDYLLRMAMRACTDRKPNGMKLGFDFFEELPLDAYIKIRDKTRSFVLRAGL